MHEVVSQDAALIANAELPWELLEGKSVLIAGANGYLPAYIVHALLMRNDLYQSNIKIIALCRNRNRAERRFSDYLHRPDLDIVCQDITFPVSVSTPVHYIIHAASPASMRDRYISPVNTFNSNVVGAYNLLNLGRDQPLQGFLFVSSVDVYGTLADSRQRLKESDSGILDGLDAKNVYSAAKRAAETICVSYAHEYGMPVKIARPFQVFGPGLELDDGRLHIDFVAQLLKKGNITLTSDGTSIRSFMYINDAVTALLAIMLKGTAAAAYNVVDEGGEASVLQLAERMAALCGTPGKISITDRPRGPTIDCVIGDSEKLRSLGWTPCFPLNTGLERMMRSYGLP